MKTIYKKEGTQKKECVEKSYNSQTTIIILAVISSIAIVLSIVAIAMHVSEDIVINDISIVLGFIGVLATFIVVTNYVQVWKLESKLEHLDNKVECASKQRDSIFATNKRLIYTIVDYLIYRDIDSALYYLQDILPILKDLYGADGREKDNDGESIDVVMEVITKLLEQHDVEKKNGKKGISIGTLTDFRSEIKKHIPLEYYNILSVQRICDKMDILIKDFPNN